MVLEPERIPPHVFRTGARIRVKRIKIQILPELDPVKHVKIQSLPDLNQAKPDPVQNVFLFVKNKEN